MPAKKKRAAIAPSKKPTAKKAPQPAAKKAAAKRKGAAKAAARKTSAKKTAAKKAAGKHASAKRAAANKASANKKAARPSSVTQAPRTAGATAPAAAEAPAATPRRPEAPPDPTELLAQALAALTLSKKADDVVILRVTELTSYADFFVLASAPSERQVQAIARHATDEMKKCGRAPLGTEGLEQGHWVLVDYGAVVLHVFLGNARHYYDLEGFWSDAPRVDVDEAVGLRTLTALEAAAADAAARAADADESPAFAVNE